MLTEIIQQISEIVAENHEKIMTMDVHTGDAQKATEKGAEHLQKAAEYAEAGFKNRCWCLLAILGLSLVALLPVLMSILHARGVL